ncbi:hypothetical protein [Streptomyces vilmorinianum]|uniref:hypothetical protein n=1 Tax=Streptomyces vilmorinianum TaxID=3051092 RepID=UPI0010FB7E90|nr:hypothetical protein [Streptomyces vilmorinianum]
MYAIHLEVPPGEFGEARIDPGELARVVPQVSSCQVEHVYRPRLPEEPDQRSVVFVSAASAPEAGTGVLAAVRFLLRPPAGRVRVELRVPREGRDVGLCHGVVSVVDDRHRP